MAFCYLFTQKVKLCRKIRKVIKRCAKYGFENVNLLCIMKFVS